MRIHLTVAALAGAVLLTGCAGTTTGPADGGQAGGAPATSPAAPAPTATTPKAPATKPKAPTKTATATTSDVSQLRALGITLDKGVLIDVADDGLDRYLAVGDNGKVDFTGTTRTDTTMMSLKPASVSGRNRVTIKPPFWNEEVGGGYCVADTRGAALRLEECADGRTTQIWEVVPAGDSGQFELKGAYGILRVDDGRLTTGTSGRTGLQTIEYAG